MSPRAAIGSTESGAPFTCASTPASRSICGPRVTAHVFICYLAYLLLSLLKFRLRPLALSPQQTLDELHTMYKVYLRDAKHGFQISRVVTLSKKQEAILKTIDRKLLKAEN